MGRKLPAFHQGIQTLEGGPLFFVRQTCNRRRREMLAGHVPFDGEDGFSFFISKHSLAL
jgi:hypothetical protein